MADFDKKEYPGVQPQVRDWLQDLQDQNNSIARGGFTLTVSPATGTPAPTAAAWTQAVTVTLKDASGAVADWVNTSYATTISAGDTSTAGTASVSTATLTFVNGVATFDLEGDEAAWLNSETATATVANITFAGNTVTGGTCVLTFTTP